MARKKSSLKKRTVKPKLNFSSISALFLIALGAGLILWSAFLSDWRNSKRDQTIVNSFETNQQSKKSKPTKLYVPKLEKTLEITDGYIENNRWTVSKSGVSFLTDSKTPEEGGNSIIYGHNTSGVLGGLWKVQISDFVYVTAGDNKVYKYKINERKEVKPNQVEILNQEGSPRVTIYTCSGFLDSARFVVIGELVEVVESI